MKDLDQESHEKSKSGALWQSAKGKGTTDETLRQSVLIAKGETVIRSMEGLQIDIKHVDQQTVSQTIDAMVKADPELAWIKEAEARGDVDWQRVKEVHDSFKYSHSGLGGAAMIVIAIIVTYLTAGAASGMVAGAAGAGGASAGAAAGAAAAGTAAAGTAAASTSIWAAATATTAAGWANVAATAALTLAASGAAISTINNRGDLGAVLKDVTSSDALKGYFGSALTAGFTSGVLDSAFGVTGDNVNKVTKGFDLSKTGDIGKFGSYLGAQGAMQAVTQTAFQGGSLSDNLQGALTGQVYHLMQAVAFNATGDLAQAKTWQEGSPEKIALHAVVGGLLSEATGGNFRSGALAAGANEALIEQLSGMIKSDKNLELAVSQLIGVAAATATGGDPAKAAELAKNATAYNRQLHPDEKALARRLAEQSGGKYTAEQIEEQLRLTSIKGTDIGPGTDMAATKDGIYDPDGNWIPAGDEYFVQMFAKADDEVIGYIKQNTQDYSWGYYEELRNGPKYDWGSVPSNAERDRLTGYALDESGGYRVPAVVDGVAYSSRFLPCGNAGCLASGANIDFSDSSTLDWIKASDASELDKLSKAMLLASLPTAGGASSVLAGTSSVASLLSGYLKEDFSGAVSAELVGMGFENIIKASGIPAEMAGKISNSLGGMGVWDSIVRQARGNSDD